MLLAKTRRVPRQATRDIPNPRSCGGSHRSCDGRAHLEAEGPEQSNFYVQRPRDPWRAFSALGGLEKPLRKKKQSTNGGARRKRRSSEKRRIKAGYKQAWGSTPCTPAVASAASTPCTPAVAGAAARDSAWGGAWWDSAWWDPESWWAEGDNGQAQVYFRKVD